MSDPEETPDPDQRADPDQKADAGAQPDLPLEDRRKKAGITRNRIGLWVVGVGFALYLIITGIVGILTKAR